MGGTVDIPVDVRIIAATNRNLKEEVEAGRFRRDLYYRVAVVTQELPPLRSRAEDIPLLARYFLARLAEQGGAVPLDIEDDALDALRQYPFPGNVRELANILERAAVFCPPGGSIGLAHLPPEVSESAVHLSVSDPGSSSAVAARQEAAAAATPVCPQAAAPCASVPAAPAPDVSTPLVPLAEMEKQHILHALELAGDNRTLAADMLGISRSSLWRKLREYGV